MSPKFRTGLKMAAQKCIKRKHFMNCDSDEEDDMKHNHMKPVERDIRKIKIIKTELKHLPCGPHNNHHNNFRTPKFDKILSGEYLIPGGVIHSDT